jgi:hypothetical protein
MRRHPNTHSDQTHLISTLSARDTSSTRIYTLLLTILPLGPALFHLPLLTHISTLIPTLLAIGSFLASAYTLYFLPLPPVQISVLNTSDLKKGDSNTWNVPTHAQPDTRGIRTAVPGLSDEVTDMVARWIVGVNGVVCVGLGVLELWQGRTWSEGVMVGGGFLPGFVMSVVLWARRELRVVDMGELEKLKYQAKGI